MNSGNAGKRNQPDMNKTYNNRFQGGETIPPPIKSIEWKEGELFLLDQTRLPVDVVVEKQNSVEQVWDAIKKLKVRGAPAIGIAGAYGLAVAMRYKLELNGADFLKALDEKAGYLDTARPTAVNLSWALKRVVQAVRAGYEKGLQGNTNDALSVASQSSTQPSSQELYHVLEQEAIAIHLEDQELCRRIGEHGLSLIEAGAGILTHCNAGRLATSDFGTALAPLYLAHEQGLSFKVYADESRPLLQGSRLTAWELQQAGIDVTLITDNMAAYVMDQGLVDVVIFGADRVAANGDVANKIGSLGVAIMAKHFDIPVYSAFPFSTIDMTLATGEGIIIEERDPQEVTHLGSRRVAPEGVKVRNPAFDVTPHELFTGLITDRGIIYPPFDKGLQKIMKS